MSDAFSGDLDSFDWDPVSQDFKTSEPEIPQELQDEIPELATAGGMTAEQFDRVVGAERFGGALAKLTAWMARRKGVPEIELKTNDPAYCEAVDVLYRRLMEGPVGRLLPYLSNRDFLDLVIVATFAVPYFAEVAKGTARVRAEKKAQAVAETAETDQSTGEGFTNEQ